MMKRTMTIVVLLLSMALTVFAQKIEIRGVVKQHTDNAPVEFANIILQTSDSVFVKGATTNEKGVFVLSELMPADYHILVTCVGYDSHFISLNGLSGSISLEDILLMESSIALEGVTVSASNMRHQSDRKIVFPTDKQLKASNNGINLLQQLMLPKLQVNPIYNTISIPGGGEVQLRINGVKVEESEVVALNPEDVLRVEYHDNPGLRYGNAEVVIDFIVRRPETGGNIRVDLTNGLNTIWGRDQISAKINHKRSEFALSYDYNPRGFKEAWRDNEEIFHYPDGSTLHRREEGEPGKMKMFWQNLNATYSLQHPEKYLFNASVRWFYNRTSNEDLFGNIYNVKNPADVLYMADKNNSKYSRPAIDLYYQHNLPKDQTLVFNIVGTYNYTESGREYQESRDGILLTDVNNMVTGDKYSIIGESIYEKKLGSNRISAGLKYTQSFSDNEYINGHNYMTHMNQSDAYGYGEYKGKVKKLDYTLGVGVSRYWYRQRGEEDFQYYTFRPRISLQYNLPENSFIRLNGSIYNSNPSLGDLSAIDQTVDSLQIQRGNPNLEPYLNYNLSLTYELQKKIFYGSLHGSYRYAPKAIMGEKYWEGDKIIQTSDNQKSWQNIQGRAYFRVGPIKDILQVSFTGGVNHYLSKGNHYSHTYTNWWYSLSGSANYKNFGLAFELFSNWNYFWGENLSGGENLHILMLNYKYKDLTFGIGAINPFADNYKVDSENWSQYASYKKSHYVNESSRMFMINVAYNFSFGRSFSTSQKRLHNSDSDSGVMSTGK